MPKAWWKFYVTLPDDKAHYTDAQFRGFVTAIAMGERHEPYGQLPKLAPLRALLGPDVVDFLIAEEDLRLGDDGHVHVVNRSTYQAPLDPTAAERQRRHRTKEPVSPRVDNGVDNGAVTAVTRDSHVIVTGVTGDALPLPLSLSLRDTKETGTDDSARAQGPTMTPVDDADRDSLDTFYELTGIRAWGRRGGEWLRELEADHQIALVDTALREEWRLNPDARALLDRVAARLAKSKERVEKAAEREARNRPPEPARATERRELTEDEQRAAAEGRKAWEALRPAYRRNGNGHRGGIATRIGDLLPSAASIGPQGHSLTGAEGSEWRGAGGPLAAERVDPETRSLSAVGGDRTGAEPGEPGPDRNEEASTPDGPAETSGE
jgi:hypothetical protein